MLVNGPASRDSPEGHGRQLGFDDELKRRGLAHEIRKVLREPEVFLECITKGIMDVWTLPQSSATIVVMSTQSLRDVRDHLSEVIDRVEHHHERVVVTRNGKPAAVIMSPEDLAELQETIDVLSDPLALADIREADAAYARGDVVRGIDAVRHLRP